MDVPLGKAVVDMVMDQGTLRLGHRPLNRVQLGREVETGSAFLDHCHDASQMTFGALQAGGDGGMACMAVRLRHLGRITPRGGYDKLGYGLPG